MSDVPIPDGSNVPERLETAPKDVDPSLAPTYVADTGVPGRTQTVKLRAAFEVREYSGPLPDPQFFRELAEIYPDAPRIILEDFQEQARHRREREKVVTDTNALLARRGQTYGFLIGLAGLGVSFGSVFLGYATAGTLIATGCVGSLVTVFVYGRSKQKQERIAKEKIRERIKQGDPVEKLEDDSILEQPSLNDSAPAEKPSILDRPEV
jgi:uncharacterized membrane protein